MLNQLLNCPKDCTWTPGPLVDDQDCKGYAQPFSQIYGVVMVPDGVNPPVDWTDAQAWVDLIDNTGATSPVRMLLGMGELPEPVPVIDTYPGLGEGVSARRYELELTVPNLSGGQYEFLRQLQCCASTAFRFWYLNVEEDLYGGPQGLRPVLVDVSFPVTGGRDDKQFALVTFEWLAQCDPLRTPAKGLASGVIPPPPAGAVAFGPVQVDDPGDGDAFGPQDATSGTADAYGPKTVR